MYEIIINPTARSGKGQKKWEKLEKVLTDNKVEYKVHYTKDFSREDTTIADLYSEYIEKGEVLKLIIMGGDGTVNGVIQRLPAFGNVEITTIPIGSSNDFARDLGIGTDAEAILEKVIKNPESRVIDIGEIHFENTLVRSGVMDIPDRRFIVSTGIGYDAAVCEEAFHSKIKNVCNKFGLGKLTYLGIALKQLASTRYITGELTLDGDEENIIPINRLLFCAGMNHRYEGGGFMFGPDADDSDGLLDLCMVSRISKLKILAVLPTAFKGKHFKYDGADHFRASKYTIRTSVPLWVHVDGEVGTMADFVEVSVKKKVLKIVY